MYFFINNAINKQNSGIEHAQIQRAKVFAEHDLDYRLIYMAWNPQMMRWLDRFGLDSQHCLTLFDYYQGTQVVDDQVVRPTDIFLSDGETKFRKIKDQNCYEVIPGNPIMGRIRWYGDDNKEQRVSTVERFDIYGNLYRVDEYDWRGFLSRSQFYTPDNKIYMFVWFDLNGKPVITQNLHLNRDGQSVGGTWDLIDRYGYRYFYNSFEQVVNKFLNDLNDEFWNKERPNFFVGDRMEGYEDAIVDLKRPAIKISHIHNSHASDVHDELHSLLNNYYEYDLYNKDQYDFYIAATHKQTNDMRQRFGLGKRIVTIPVGLTRPVKQVSLSDRKKHSVLVTARRAEEKQIDKIIEAVGMAHKQIPDITLDVWGYRDSRNHDAAKKKIDAMIEKYDAKDYVSINNYNPDLDSQRDKHQVYMVFSTMEGFNIALMEAQNHGEIAVVNDVNYGPNELTVDGKNGYVVGYDDVKAASEKLVKIFSDDNLAQQLSNNAYELSKRYSSEEIYKAWMSLTDQAMDMWHSTVLRDVDEQGLENVGVDKTGKPVAKESDINVSIDAVESQQNMSKETEKK